MVDAVDGQCGTCDVVADRYARSPGIRPGIKRMLTSGRAVTVPYRSGACSTSLRGSPASECSGVGVDTGATGVMESQKRGNGERNTDTET